MDNQPLLDKGIVICPDLDDFEFPKFVEAFHTVTPKANGEIELWLNGYGGSPIFEAAICDLVSIHGNVRGVIWGEANSAIAIIWATCQKRSVNVYSVLAVHRAHYRQKDAVQYNQRDYEAQGRLAKFYDERAAIRFASVSNKPFNWWLKQMDDAHDAMTFITAGDLVTKYEMADWYKP